MLGLQAIFWTQFAWVGMTNFWGFDEWLLIALLSKGIREYPYANRPLMVWWSVPAALLTPHGLGGYYVMQALYLSLTGWLSYLLCRRALPGLPSLAFLTGAFTLVWAPSDPLRLQSVSLLAYPGSTCGYLLALLLFLESWFRSSRALLALGGLVGLATARSFEAVIPFLLFAPLLLPLRERPRRFWAWVIAWEAVVALAVALTLLPFLRQEFSYQSSLLRIDLSPAGVSRRLLEMYFSHLAPLVTVVPGALKAPAVPLAVGVFALAYTAFTTRFPEPPPGPEARGSLARLMAVGFVAAGLGYGTLALSSTGGPRRSEFLSAPGIALLLASGICLAATWLRAERRRFGAAALASWVVAVGTSCTLASQAAWDGYSAYGPQNRMLVQLTDQVPDVKPHTLLVVLNEMGAWRAIFTFRNIVEHLYQGRATGYVLPALDIFYPTRFAPDGIHCEPLPVIQKGWRSPATVHGYDETIVLRHTAAGPLVLLEEWPTDLPPLPDGARYEPRAHIVRGGAPAPERALLARR